MFSLKQEALPNLVFTVSNAIGIRLSVHFNGQINRFQFENGQQHLGLRPLAVRNIILSQIGRTRQKPVMIHARGLFLQFVREHYDPISRTFVFRGRVLVSQMDEAIWFRGMQARRALAQQRRRATLQSRRAAIRQHLNNLYQRAAVVLGGERGDESTSRSGGVHVNANQQPNTL